MRPNEKTLEEFMCLYEAEFGESLTREEAIEMWTRLMNLYLTLYRYPKEEKLRTDKSAHLSD